MYRVMKNSGQSEVIATILLVLIVVSAFSGIWIWYMGRYSGRISNIYMEKERSIYSMNEKIVIEKVIFVPGEVDVYITNIGVETSIDTLYIDNIKLYDQAIHILSGRSTWVNVTYNWQSDKLYEIKVCAYYGNCFKVMVRAP
ncbi:MAG: hypothetical protein DRJ64_03840 [Thermoprotei archaeon]|nr:MAG: hypothetical protein DRJ64_03840 [Thermoprotei archaeon]